MTNAADSDSPAAGVRSVVRALRLLRALSPERPHASLSDFARHGNLPVSTTQRLLLTLESEGFLKRLSNGNYTLGISAVQLGLVARDSMSLIDLARSHLEKIASLTGETVNLALLSAPGRALYIDQVQSPHALRPHSWLGRTIPSESSAVGRALEGNAGDEGYVASRKTIEPDITAVASPVYGQTGSIVAAMSITAPTSRVNDAQLKRYAGWLTREAALLTMQLGGTWPHDNAHVRHADDH
jgi:DNA-binding IclR family transcriptional regulator